MAVSTRTETVLLLEDVNDFGSYGEFTILRLCDAYLTVDADVIHRSLVQLHVKSTNNSRYRRVQFRKSQTTPKDWTSVSGTCHHDHGLFHVRQKKVDTEKTYFIPTQILLPLPNATRYLLRFWPCSVARIQRSGLKLSGLGNTSGSMRTK